MFHNTGANAFAKNQMRLAYEDKRDLYCSLSTPIVEFLKQRWCYFKKLDNSDLEFIMKKMRLNNCNGLAVISSLRIFSVGHCRNGCNIVIMSQLYPSEVVTSHFLHCYCSMMYSFVAIDGFICNNSSDMETKLLQMFFLICVEVKD